MVSSQRVLLYPFFGKCDCQSLTEPKRKHNICLHSQDNVLNDTHKYYLYVTDTSVLFWVKHGHRKNAHIAHIRRRLSSKPLPQGSRQLYQKIACNVVYMVHVFICRMLTFIKSYASFKKGVQKYPLGRNGLTGNRI